MDLIEHWLNNRSLQNAPQETEIESYVIGGIKQDVKKDQFKNLNYNGEKRKNLFSCETKYTIVWDIEEQDLEPLTCPFCGYEVTDEEDEVEWVNQKTKKTIIGIDYSLTSPAICVMNVIN